jgi:cytochrome c556
MSKPNSRLRRPLARTALAATLVAVGATALAPQSIAQQNPGAQWIKYRQSAYTVLVNNFSPLGAMAAGKIPFDAKMAATRAERVAFMATIVPEVFPAESQSGAPTKAKAGIWQNRAEFDQLMKSLGEKTAALSVAAKGGNADTFKAAFGEAQKACKACHDKFKEE